MAFYRCGGGGIPSSLKTDMNAVFNKKFGTAVDYPAEGWPDTVNLMGPLPEKTVSGSIAHITDGADEVPIKSWDVEIAPTLTGKSAIECTKSGKNLLNPTYLEDGYSLGANGLPTPVAKRIATTTAVPIHGGNITISYDTTVNTVQYMYATFANSTLIERVAGKTNGSTINAQNADEIYISLYDTQSSDITGGSVVTNVMIEVGSSASSYSPYTAPTVSTVNLGRTIYGGTADVVKGEGSETYARIDLGTLNYTLRNGVGMQSNGVSSLIQNPPDNYTKTTAIATDYTADTWQLVMGSGTSSGLFGVSGGYICFATTETDAATFKASMSGKYLVFPLATPTDFTFTPITPTPETALGVNNFWADEGDTEVTYRRDIDLALGGQ